MTAIIIEKDGLRIYTTAFDDTKVIIERWGKRLGVFNEEELGLIAKAYLILKKRKNTTNTTTRPARVRPTIVKATVPVPP